MPLAANVTIDATTWAALALVLTILGAAYTWVSWKRRGAAAAVRGLAWTLIPVAAWLTGTLRLAANVLEAVIDWGSRLVFSPTVWLGIIVAGVAALLWVASGLMRARGIGVRGAGRQVPAGRAKEVPAGQQKGAPARRPARNDDDLDDMDDIEAILKKLGI
jgi:hypothetical protein